MTQININLHPPYFLNEVGKRENNEDNIYPFVKEAKKEDRIFLVCDGVGGSNKGEIASKIVCESFGAFLKSKPDHKEVNQAFLSEALKDAEKNLSVYATAHPECKGMKTTLTLVWFRPEGAWVAWCGDSRVYQFRNGRIVYKTEDHSLVNKLVKEGQITAQEAENHPHGNVILRAISGESEPAELDIVLLDDLRTDDLFMLCSDGITEKLTDTNLTELASLDDLEMMHEQIGQFCENFSRDNYSMYLLGLKQVDQIEIPPATTQTKPAVKQEKQIEETVAVSSEKPSIPVDSPKENNLIKYVLGGLSLIALLIGLFSYLGFQKKKTVQTLIDQATDFQQTNQLDSAMHYLNLASEKDPENPVIAQSKSEIEVQIERQRKAESIEKAHTLAIQNIDNRIRGFKSDTLMQDSLRTLQLSFLYLKKDIENGMHQFQLGEKERAFELLEWKDSLKAAQRIFTEKNWETLANLYGLFADGDSTKLARQTYCEQFLKPIE